MKKLNRATEVEWYGRGELGQDYIDKYYGIHPFPSSIEIPQTPASMYPFPEQRNSLILTADSSSDSPCCNSQEQLPSAREMISNLRDSFSAWRQAGYKLASEEEHARRFAYCSSCTHLTEQKRCLKCGCFMELKSKLEGMKCPIGQW